MRPPRIGVLASQGGFAAHLEKLRRLKADTLEVRVPAELDGLDGLVIPGGESTTISKAFERDGLAGPIIDFHGAGGAIFGTCAGMIVCDRGHLGLLDADARRNAFGRQLQSFEAELPVAGIGPEPIRAIFIRAPWVEDHSDDVEVLAEWEGHPVAVRQGRLIATAFHPELSDDHRIHALFMAMADARTEAAR